MKFERDLDNIIACEKVIREQMKWLKNVEYELDKTESVQVSGGGIHRPTETVAMDYTDEESQHMTMYEKRRRLIKDVEAQLHESASLLKMVVKWLNPDKIERRMFPRPTLEPIDQRLETAWDNEAGRKRTKKFIEAQKEKQAQRMAAGEGWGSS